MQVLTLQTILIIILTRATVTRTYLANKWKGHKVRVISSGTLVGAFSLIYHSPSQNYTCSVHMYYYLLHDVYLELKVALEKKMRTKEWLRLLLYWHLQQVVRTKKGAGNIWSICSVIFITALLKQLTISHLFREFSKK